MRHRGIGRGRERGYVLALTISILALMLAVVTGFALKTSQARQEAEREIERTEALVAFHDVQSLLKVTMATLPRAASGFGLGDAPLLAAAGQPYRAEGGVLVQLQDARGLLNLNSASADAIERFLYLHAIPHEEAVAMLDVLMDYRDVDDSRRLNGAERGDYLAMGLSPPKNDLLRVPDELSNMPRWKDHNALLLACRKECSTAQTVGINPYTATQSALMAVLGGGGELAAKIVEKRNSPQVIASGEVMGLAGTVGVSGLNSQISPFLSKTILLTIWKPSLKLGRQYSITVTPSSDYGPWRVDYVNPMFLDFEFSEIDQLPFLPTYQQIFAVAMAGTGAPTALFPGGGGAPAAIDLKVAR